jgi:ketosteroid isomerase-like protein
MRSILFLLTLLFGCAGAYAQTDLQLMLETEKAFHRAAVERGMKPAFLEYLSSDSVFFHTTAVNGREFWRSRQDRSPALLIRNPSFADISSNGRLGYTTGSWTLYPRGKNDVLTEYGQYVTIWEKGPDDKFHASLDIDISHEKLPVSQMRRKLTANKIKDRNKKGYSAADASMNFLRMSMGRDGLGAAYERFAASDVVLLREKAPPIRGKRRVVKATKNYVSIDFPKRIATYESGDLAYVWNPCEYADSGEGTEKGSCLQIWKLRDAQWYIVLGVLARVPNLSQPTITVKQKTKASKD